VNLSAVSCIQFSTGGESSEDSETHFEDEKVGSVQFTLVDQVVVYSELHRTLGVIVRRNSIVFLRVLTEHLAALVCSVLIAALPRVCSLLLEKKNSELEGGKRKVNIVSKMGDVPVPGYQTLWTNKLSTLKSEIHTLVQQYPEADPQLKQLIKVLGDIKDVAGHIPASVGESAERAAIVNAAEGNGASCCRDLPGKPLSVPCTALIQ
jgi:hypothetical protein